ncbi:MAG: hypothetical protein ABH829_00360 [archaeon]
MAEENIFVKSGDYVLPFSPWLLTQEIMPTGIHPEKAHTIAKQVGDLLKAEGRRFVSPHDITELIEKSLDAVDPKLPGRYKVWHEFRTRRANGEIKTPLIILIGGGTGTGKSSVALEVAHRLCIRNVIGTDYVREVLRTLFSETILPDIYLSTYDAWEAVKIPIAPGEDKVAVGYIEQVKHVSVGIDAIIQRARKEGKDVVIEGIHILPGMFKYERDDLSISTVVLTVNNKDEHRLRISQRGVYSSRESTEYLKRFDNIRNIQHFINEQASSRGVPVIDNVTFDKTLEAIIEKTTSNVTKILGN